MQRVDIEMISCHICESMFTFFDRCLQLADCSLVVCDVLLRLPFELLLGMKITRDGRLIKFRFTQRKYEGSRIMARMLLVRFIALSLYR